MSELEAAARAVARRLERRAIKVAAEAVADRLEQRGWVPADCPENRMLRLALGRGPDPMEDAK